MKVFIHIPKTGGTTLARILSEQILFRKFRRLNPKRTTHPKIFLEKAKDLLDDVIRTEPKIEVVGGHFGFGAHPLLSNPNAHFTILRDPVDRVISEYFYMRNKGMFYQELIKGEQLSLSDYVNHKETFYLNNLQSRLIAGESYASGEEVKEDTYYRAVDNLKKFAVFGITEQMSETLALFYLALNWKRLPYYLESNANDQRPARNEISKEDILAITRRDKFDVMLYDEAKKIFEDRLAASAGEISGLVKKIQHPGPGYKLYLKLIHNYRKALGKIQGK